MSELDSQDASLGPDRRFDEPLARVAFQPGMLFGVEAARSEQDYHRRRVNRHAYWHHGSGTVCGLHVSVQGDDPPPPDDVQESRVRLFVTGGIGVDGLGRDVAVHEGYCIDLGRWLASKRSDERAWGALERDGLDEAANTLWLKVTMRHRDCESGLQPVLAEAVNAGTDPVKPSRMRDSVLFELHAERPLGPEGEAPAFVAHRRLPTLDDILGSEDRPDDLSPRLGPRDEARLDEAEGVARDHLEMATRLLFATSPGSHALDSREADAETLARTMLARVSIGLGPGRKLIINPLRVEVDNLVRPFLFGTGLLARLARQA